MMEIINLIYLYLHIILEHSILFSFKFIIHHLNKFYFNILKYLNHYYHSNILNQNLYHVKIQ